jgi:hypothetical protein
MKTFQWTVRVMAFIPLLTGLLEVFMGLGSLKTNGVQLPNELMTQASVDNNWRFLGTVWAGLRRSDYLCGQRSIAARNITEDIARDIIFVWHRTRNQCVAHGLASAGFHWRYGVRVICHAADDALVISG